MPDNRRGLPSFAQRTAVIAEAHRALAYLAQAADPSVGEAGSIQSFQGQAGEHPSFANHALPSEAEAPSSWMAEIPVTLAKAPNDPILQLPAAAVYASEPLPEAALGPEQWLSTADPKLPVSATFYELLPYTNYIAEIITFSSPTAPRTYPFIRSLIQTLCRANNVDHISVSLPLRTEQIFSPESGTFIFADHVTSSDASMCAFFTPDSQFVWFHFTSKPLVRPPLAHWIAHLVEQGELVPRQSWRPGGKLHRKFWETACQACYHASEENQDRARLHGILVQVLKYSFFAKGALRCELSKRLPLLSGGMEVMRYGRTDLFAGFESESMRYGMAHARDSSALPPIDQGREEAVGTEYTDGNRWDGIDVLSRISQFGRPDLWGIGADTASQFQMPPFF